MFNLDVNQFPFIADGETIELTYDGRWPECYRFILCCPQGAAFRIRMLPLKMPFDQIVKWLCVNDETYSKHAPYASRDRGACGLEDLPIL
jgi:hypothetical protein